MGIRTEERIENIKQDFKVCFELCKIHTGSYPKGFPVKSFSALYMDVMNLLEDLKNEIRRRN